MLPIFQHDVSIELQKLIRFQQKGVRLMKYDEIRTRRVLQRMSQKELAERANVDRSYISQIENGKLKPSLSILERIAAALGCSLKDFF
jgi:predicted transcriptional regulator